MSLDFPYPGLRPFHREETDIFFGREEQVDQLLGKLGKSRFLAVVGPSGCGKSSLIRTGLISALETGFLSSTGARWRIAEVRPGNHPLRNLAEALLAPSALGPERAGQPDAVAFLEATLWRGPWSLVEALGETPLPEKANLLLLVDQFEEIFRYHWQVNRDEAEAFVTLLLTTAAQNKVPVYTVLTMRSDFLGECALFTGLPEALNDNQFLTPRLTREQRRAAIVGPARVFGGDVDPILVNRLLNDMGEDPDQLPLLQHVLRRMWERRGGPNPPAPFPATFKGIFFTDTPADPPVVPPSTGGREAPSPLTGRVGEGSRERPEQAEQQGMIDKKDTLESFPEREGGDSPLP
jgi:energy-coupling factor transporter ATP-binding protein EcfA2